MTTTVAEELAAPYALSRDHIEQYRRDGFVKLKDVLSAESLAYYGEVITNHVLAHNPLKDVPMDQRDTYSKAFIQVMNLWRKEAAAREFALSAKLARIATELMGTRGVRMYHDQALYKEPSGGFTPWHADQQYWPLETEKTVTAWIPLTAVSQDMGPLAFAAGSHEMTIGRDLEISDQSEQQIATLIEQGDYLITDEPFELGEVSFHSGWTYHRAGPNTTDQPRKVMTVIYMDKDMRLAPPKNFNQARDWVTWCPGAKLGE
ncbi:MAG: phytanoyl-CoA dioxygenase family protein, partial [Rhodospirillales bacterium]|nr:phytanoyl-CoA dioxygenase family protein [Rhodospirillales bacterium]